MLRYTLIFFLLASFKSMCMEVALSKEEARALFPDGSSVGAHLATLYQYAQPRVLPRNWKLVAGAFASCYGLPKKSIRFIRTARERSSIKGLVKNGVERYQAVQIQTCLRDVLAGERAPVFSPEQERELRALFSLLPKEVE